MYHLSSRPLSISQIIIHSFKLYKASFPKIWYWLLLFSLPQSLSSFLGPSLQQHLNQNDLLTVVLFSLTMLIFAGWIFFGQCFIFSRIHSISHATDNALSLAFWTSLRKILPVFAGIIFIVTLLAVIILSIFFLAFSIQHIIGTLGVVIMEMIGSGLTFYLMVTQFYFIPSVLFDNLSVGKAIFSSFYLTWGYWWRTLLPMVTFIFFILLCFFLINFIILMLFSLISVESIYATRIGMGIGFAEGLLINIFLVPLLYTATIILFDDLKLRKARGFDKG